MTKDLKAVEAKAVEPPAEAPSVLPLKSEGVDRVFAERMRQSDFKFNPETAKVFDDMVSRSVPFYGEMQRMTAEIAADFAQAGTALYDLGCSTGTTLALLDGAVDPNVGFVGFDNSQPMLDKAKAKLAELGVTRPVELVNADLHRLPPLENASVAVMNLTLQFVRPLYREKLVQRICEGTVKDGCLILIEKLTIEDSRLNRLYIDYYYAMKRRNGYSEIEISQKRESLENVLIPYRYDENVELLKAAGYHTVETFFRWYNFCGLLAVK